MYQWQQLGIALGLGLLVGMQRERVSGRVAGVRTFPLIALFGAVSGLLNQNLGGWVVAAGLVGVAAVLILGKLTQLQQESVGPGVTTEIAALLMFGVGALLTAGDPISAITAGGSVAVLLHWKEPLHHFVKRLGDDDFRMIIQLALIALVILPLMPDRTYGPYQVLNPFEIWRTVVLIVSISVGAYVAQKLVGAQAGIVLSGIFGGLVSSTATTVGQCQESRQNERLTPAAAVIIMLASAVVFGRILFEVTLVAPGMLRQAAGPLLVMLGLMLSISLLAFARIRSHLDTSAEQSPHSNLKVAIVFGVLYAGVLLGVAAAEKRFGARGLYAVAAISGMVDMDAITLSSAKLVKAGRLEADRAWRVIIVAAMANLVFKLSVVAALGHRRLLGWMAGLFGGAFVAAGLILAFWP